MWQIKGNIRNYLILSDSASIFQLISYSSAFQTKYIKLNVRANAFVLLPLFNLSGYLFKRFLNTCLEEINPGQVFLQIHSSVTTQIFLMQHTHKLTPLYNLHINQRTAVLASRFHTVQPMQAMCIGRGGALSSCKAMRAHPKCIQRQCSCGLCIHMCTDFVILPKMDLGSMKSGMRIWYIGAYSHSC